MNSNCDASSGEEHAWEWVSKDFDSLDKQVASYSVHIGYPLKNTQGEISITGVSVTPVTWVSGGTSLKMSSSLGELNGNDYMELDTTLDAHGSSGIGLITNWLVLGARNAGKNSAGTGLFRNDNNDCLSGVAGTTLDEASKQLPIKLDWKEGDIVDITDNKYNSAEGAAWVRYRDNGKAKSSCGGCNNGVGLNFECHFCGGSSVGSDCDGSSAFALTYLYSDKPHTVTFQYGGDDGMYAWINGEDLINQNSCQCYASNQFPGKE